MPLRTFVKRNRAGLRRLFAIANLEIFGLVLLLEILKSDLTPEMTVGQVRWFAIGYAAAGIVVFGLCAIRWRASVYLGAVTWSRRFSQPTLIVVVFPVFVVLMIGSIPFVRGFFPSALEAFWDRGNVRGLVAVGAAVGFDAYLAILLSSCLLAWTRKTRCGSKSYDDSIGMALSIMLIATAVYGVLLLIAVAHFMPGAPWPSIAPTGQFHSDKRRRLMISGC